MLLEMAWSEFLRLTLQNALHACWDPGQDCTCSVVDVLGPHLSFVCLW